MQRSTWSSSGLYLAFTAAQVWGDIALREPPHLCHCDGAVCHRRDRLRVADRQPQPAFHWRDLGRARPHCCRSGPSRNQPQNAATITLACIFALTGPCPKRAATALAAASVAALSRVGSRASISLRKGDPSHKPMTALRGEGARLICCTISAATDENPAFASSPRIVPMS